jgi:EAL domain-containing protein (putative c-di-GMP-specific phosphodiesterase class I)
MNQKIKGRSVALRRAIERNEFELRYQPIIHLESGRIQAFEVLIRWRHPTRGLIMPSEFIPLAEKSGLICEIGRWVLQAACDQTAAWHAQYPSAADVAVAVNLSARQFASGDLVRMVQSALRSSGLSPRHLILEITETLLMDNAQRTHRVIARLKGLGVRLSIDDFGAGYSSLAYLRDFDMDTMKIDRSFVARLDDRHEDIEIIRTIISLAHTLNMTVIAEGVEKLSQLLHLRKMACENSQGYLYRRPLHPSAAGQLLAAGAAFPFQPARRAA